MRTGRVVLEGPAADLLADEIGADHLPRRLARRGWGGAHDLEPRVRVHGPGGAARPAAAPPADDHRPGPSSTCRTGAPQLEERGVRPRDIKSLDDVRHLPLHRRGTRCAEVSPFGGFALPTDEVVRVHSSSGATGKPDRAGLLARRHQHLDGADGPGRRGRRRAPRRPRPDGVPLRHVHQRLGHALRHGAHRRHHHPGRRRADRAARRR